MHTFLNGLVAELEVYLNVFAFGIHQRKYNMGLFCRYLQVLQTWCSSNDCLDVVLFHQLLVGCCIEISQQQFPSAWLWIGWQDDVIGLVFLLSIIIMQHNIYKLKHQNQ